MMQTVKIVVTGPFSSGKTEFIRSVSEIDVVSTERKISTDAEKIKETTTVAMDFGRITVDEDLVLYLFGTPGQRRFDFMWEILSEGMLGFIVMVDSTRPETFREARSILETFRAYAPTPYVVAANKQDRPDAWDVDDMRVALRIDPKIKILPCVARKRESVKSVPAGVVIWDSGGDGTRRFLIFGALRIIRVIDHNRSRHCSLRSLWKGKTGHSFAWLVGFLGPLAGDNDLPGPVLPHLRP